MYTPNTFRQFIKTAAVGKVGAPNHRGIFYS